MQEQTRGKILATHRKWYILKGEQSNRKMVKANEGQCKKKKKKYWLY